jgi:hypothetical protein
MTKPAKERPMPSPRTRSRGPQLRAGALRGWRTSHRLAIPLSVVLAAGWVGALALLAGRFG